MQKWLILLSTLAVSLVSAAPAWRWVDANGTVHYSDRPVPGAVAVNLPDSGTPAATPARQRASQPSTPAVPDTTQRYSRFDIVSPAQQQVFWNVGGTVTVDAVVEPNLQAGHRLALIYDGQRQDLVATGSRFVLTAVFRGTHTVQAQIIDASDNVVLQSLPVEFMVQQTSLQNPNNPNRN